MTDMPVVVLAGGLGTRLLEVTGDLMPKVLVPVDGRPFIDYKLRGLARLGVGEVVLLVGHMAEHVRAHVGDGSRFGLSVTCLEDGDSPLGTAGAVARAAPILPRAFWLTYGDTFVEAPLTEVEQLLGDGTDAVMTVIENVDRWEPSNVTISKGRVVTYEKGASEGTHLWLDYGLLLFRRSVFDPFDPAQPLDLSEVVREIVEEGRMAAWQVTERFWDIGTPEALAATERRFVASGLWEQLA